MTTRHLICLIDGTWVAADTSIINQRYSNIYKLGMYLRNYSGEASEREENIVFYYRGLGSNRSRVLRYTSGGFAAGLEEEIADVYVNLSSNYQNGDKIYLFGFSRGAVAARAVAGVIGSIGLLRDNYVNRYKDVWNLYLQGKQENIDLSDLKDKCFADVKIEFLGVFDTVFGGNDSEQRRIRKLGHHNLHVAENIKAAVQILSLDDCRAFFRPMVWNGGQIGRAEQIWMPGVHSDVGGTYDHDFLGDVSLLTMVDRVSAQTRLSFHSDLKALFGTVKQRIYNKNIKVNNEMESWWWKLGAPSTRVLSGPDDGQYLHPIANILRNLDIDYKGKPARYSLHPSFQTLRPCPSFSTYDFHSLG